VSFFFWVHRAAGSDVTAFYLSYLFSGNERIDLSSDECQVRWMEINPVVEEDEEDEGNGASLGGGDGDASFRHSFQNNDFHLYREDAATAWVETSTPGTAPQAAQVDDNEIRPVERTIEAMVDSLASVEVPEGCPRLELSLSDADLDALLNSLPNANEAAPAAADSKFGNNSGTDCPSEMQWVLAFLSNPDEAAHRDAEAKNMLVDTSDRSEDDHFQYFLQQLSNANLMTPEVPIASTDPSAPTARQADSKNGRTILVSDDEDEEDSDEDWMEGRKHFKTLGPSRTTTAKVCTRKTGPTHSHKRRLHPRANHMDEVLPPAAPIRYPPPLGTASDDAETDDLEDNGLDALPRYEPPPATDSLLQIPPQPVAPPATRSSSKLLALSQEIGQQLQKHGQFQFPRRLFRDADYNASVDGEQHEQAPEDEP
jgi:hypothetical protein